MNGSDGRSSLDQGVHRRPLGRIAALVAVLVVAAGCAGPAPTLPPVPSTTPLPSGIAQPTSVASPAATLPADGGWTPVKPAGLPQVATLVPTLRVGDTVARTTAFLLTSLDGQPALDLARRVVAEPPVTFSISKSGTDAILRPTAALAPATRYQLSIPRPDGTVAASWTAHTAGPLHVADTVPGDTATGVPIDTGIEVTFDQAGVTTAAMAAHFSITPATAGRFEVSGRSLAFVPDKPLRKATLYAVTVRHGLPLGSTGETLAKDVLVRFETSGTAPGSGVRVWLADSLVDATPRERAALSLWVDVPEGSAAPKTVPLTVHRLAGLDAAVSAWEAVAAAPDWTLVTAREAVPTGSLPRVVSSSASVHALDDGTRWIQLPTALPLGWYVVTVRFAGMARQLVLQVTDTATYAMVTTTRMAVWVNDLLTQAPAVGATATLADVALPGAADGQGLLVGPTPSRVVSGAADTPILIVSYRGNRTFRPAAGPCMACSGKGGTTDPSRWWRLLTTDRTQYRQTDTVNIVGVAKGRATGAAPTAVSLVLFPNASDGTGTPIQTQTATPDARGMYTAKLKLTDLPIGGYWVRAKAGGDPVGETWFEIATIRKPAYAIAVTPARHAVISGQPLNVAVSTAFFEGTPVAGVPLAVSASPEGTTEAALATDTAGQATGTVHPKTTNSQFEVLGVTATPTLPEEASLAGNTQVAVFAGSAFVSLKAAVAGAKVTVSGAVNSVAFARFEGAGTDLSAVDPRGAPRAGAAVRVTVVAHSLQLHKVGTTYNFITKRVEPKYEATEKQQTLPAQTARTGADGSFRIAIPATEDAFAYGITASYRDEAGRQVQAEGWTESPSLIVPPLEPPTLIAIDGHSQTQTYAVGDTIRVRFAAPAGATTERYLFLTLQQGLLAATVGSGSTFALPFTSASVPDVAIGAARFNGNGYEVVGWLYTARLDPSSRTMSVSLTPDKARYQPGDTATVSLRTLDPAGRPVAASVFVRAIDEKLYAMGAAYDDDPVSALYTDVPSGLIAITWSHRFPANQGGGGGGDTTGGGGGAGGRTDFRDWLVAKVVHTNSSGQATVQIPLSDDLTSWRVTATAVDSRLDAGATSVKLPVGLPFFVDAVLAPEYLASDRPVLRVRSFGTALRAGTRVSFTVSSDTLPMAEIVVTVDAFGSAYLPLPALSVGSHRVRIAGSAVVDGETLSDALVRTFAVVERRATQLRTTWSPLTGTTQVKSGAGMTSVVLVDAGRGRVVPILEQLASPGAVRSDQELASALANRVLHTQFGLPPVAEPDPNGLDVYGGMWDGLSIVSWGSAQLDVTALAAMARDPRLGSQTTSTLLSDVAASTDETRARRLLALAGLAALGEPVGSQIRDAAAQTDLTVEEQVNLALAALEGGDEVLAGTVEQQVLGRAGLRSGDQVRIDAGPGADGTVVTARLAIVAASLGDPVAAEMDAYLEAHPSKTTLVDLERALAARGWATRVAPTPASAAVTVGGSRHEVTLDAGEASAEVLTPAQATSATIEPLSGSVLVVQTWDDALTPASLIAPDGVTVKRTVSPSGTVAADSTVVVTYAVTIPDAARGTPWRLVDQVPSGLAPIPWYGAMADVGGLPGDVSPTVVDGQRVEFCVGWAPDRSEYTLRYVARVVTPGTYTWEPAVVQSTVDPSSGLTVPPTTITIQTPGS